MNILVVGGAGFIGSHTCYALEESGYRPIVYDNFSSGYRDLITPFSYVEGNISDTNLLIKTLLEFNIGAVFHFAAYISVSDSVKDPISYYENNVLGSLSLFKALSHVGIPYLVISSTAAVYGTPDNCIPVTEESRLAPLSPYATSKIMMEQMARDISQVKPLSVATLRYFNAAGCDPKGRTGQRHIPSTQIIPRLFMAITGDSKCFSLYGTDYNTKDGTCIRDYIHVTDLANAHVRALEYLQDPSHKNITCNLGTNIGTSNKELIRVVEEVTGRQVPLREESRRAGDPAYVIADSTKAFRELEWTPQYSDLNTIVKTAWDWFIEDREKYPRYE